MILTVTLNPAIDKLLVLKNFVIHKLHRLDADEISFVSPGGKGVNIALNLKLLGDEVIASGFAGGHSGHLLCDKIRQAGITTSFIFSPGLTRTNISILDREHETLTEINDAGQDIPGEDQDFFLENYKKLLKRVNFVVLAGSLPEGIETSFYHKLIMLARRERKKVILHTSPNYMDELIDTGSFLINPDMRSFHQLLGKPCDGIKQFLEVGKQILVKNADTEIVLFTHRIENVVAVTRTKNFVLRPKDLGIVNMLGYADAYLAGFIHAYKKKIPMEEILKYASACGLTNVEHVHKEVKSVELIETNLSRIAVEEIV
jgi:1-phosphofructokinase family hexose kinase